MPDPEAGAGAGAENTQTIRLADARDRLFREREDLAERAANLAVAESDEEARTQAVQIRDEAETVESHAHGLQWAVEQWGEDATVTVRALTAGDSARVDQHLDQHWMGDASESIRSHARIAVAIESAPFVDPGSDLTDTHTAIADLDHDGFVDWLAAEVEDFSTPGLGNWQPFESLVRERLSTR